MSEQKIGNWEAIALVLTIIMNHVILELPKDIIQTTSSASIINVIFISFIALIIVYLISNLLKKFPGLDIFDISKFLGGSWLKIIICILFLCYILFTISTLIRSFSEILKVIFFPRTPLAIIMLLFFICVVVVNKLKFKALARANLFFTILVLINLVFIFLGNLDNFTWERIYPILGNGAYTTFFSGLSNLYAFGGISYLYLVPPYLKSQKDFKNVAFISIGISAFCLLISVATLLFMFPPVITSQQIFSMYLVARFIEFGTFFQRIDAVFLLVWLLSILCYLSFAFYFVTVIFKKLTNIKSTKWCTSLFTLFSFGIALLPRNMQQVSALENDVYKHIILILIFIISLGVLVFANIKRMYMDKKKGAFKIDEKLY